MGKLVLLILSFALASSAQAEIKLTADLVPPGPTSQWFKSYRATAKKRRDRLSYAECRGVKTLPGAALCLFSSRAKMQAALLRASAFIEGGDGFSAGIIYKHSSKEIAQLERHVAGIDLKDADLLKFYTEAKNQCEIAHGDSDICFSKSETEIFEKVILPSVEKPDPFVLIAVGIEPSATDTISHEIMHAQYFLVPAFRETVDAFWARLGDGQKALIKQYLFMYDPSNDFLIRNEFQAYVLQSGAEVGMLSPLVPKVRPLLISWLAARGLAPIQIR